MALRPHDLLTSVASSCTAFFSMLTSSSGGPSVSMSTGLSGPAESWYLRNWAERKQSISRLFKQTRLVETGRSFCRHTGCFDPTGEGRYLWVGFSQVLDLQPGFVSLFPFGFFSDKS